MSKRGRPPLPADRRRHVRVSVAVRSEVADGMFIYAQKKSEPLSVILNRIFERLVQREKELAELTAYQNTETGWPLRR